jgi:hypothetical protein
MVKSLFDFCDGRGELALSIKSSTKIGGQARCAPVEYLSVSVTQNSTGQARFLRKI